MALQDTSYQGSNINFTEPSKHRPQANGKPQPSYVIDTGEQQELQEMRSGDLNAQKVLRTAGQQENDVSIHPRDGISPLRWKVFLATLNVMSFLFGYDTSNTANIQASAYKSLGHIEILSWLALGFSTGNIAVIPLCRKLIGIFDLRYLMAVSLAFIVVSTAISGSASSLVFLIVGRVLNGVGLGCAYQIILSYVAIFSKTDEIPGLTAVLGVSYCIGLLCGPLIGGAFAQNIHATWRWAFYFNFFPAAIGALSIFLAPVDKTTSKFTAFQRLARIDWTGAILHTCSIVLLYLSLTFSGSLWAWNSGPVIALWVVWGVIFLCYVVQQHFCFFTAPEHRIFPVNLVYNYRITLVMLGVWGLAMAHSVTLYYTPLLLAFTHKLSPFGTAERIMPYLFMYIIFAMGSGKLIVKSGRYNLFFFFAGTCTIIGTALMTQVKLDTSLSNIMGYEVIIGAGIGSMLQGGLGIASAMVTSTQRGDLIVLYMTAQLGGVSTTLAMAGCIFNNVGYEYVTQAIAEYGNAVEFTNQDVREALAGVANPLLSDSNSPLLQLILQAVNKLITHLFYIGLGAGCFIILLALLMPRERLRFEVV